MKKTVSLILLFCMFASIAAGCDGSSYSRRRERSEHRRGRHSLRDRDDDDDTDPEPTETEPSFTTVLETEPTITPFPEPTETEHSDEPQVIRVWSYNEEVGSFLDYYLLTHPEFDAQYDIEMTVIPVSDGSYEPALDMELVNEYSGSPDVIDIYVVESAYAPKYITGEMSSYACPYTELGIDVDNLVSEAQIAPYIVSTGTNSNGEIVGLSYQSCAGAIIYRRSIARDFFGTDDPDEVAGYLGIYCDSWYVFDNAALELAGAGYYAVNSIEDLWIGYRYCSDSLGWILEDGSVNIDPCRDIYLDAARFYLDPGLCGESRMWFNEWFQGMNDTGDRQTFCYLGPAWLVNYTMESNCGSYGSNGELLGTFDDGVGTYGDWAVCVPPLGFAWGGNWIIANANSDNKQAVGELIEWMTLDCSTTGLQYLYANGTFNSSGTIDTVPSNVVMDMCDGRSDFLGGQNMFEVYSVCNEIASLDGLQYGDTERNNLWLEYAEQYARDEIDRDTAIEEFTSEIEG